MNLYECQLLLGYVQTTCHITSINNEHSHGVPVKSKNNKNEKKELRGGNCRNNENNGYVQKSDILTCLNTLLTGNC